MSLTGLSTGLLKIIFKKCKYNSYVNFFVKNKSLFTNGNSQEMSNIDLQINLLAKQCD